MKKLLPVLNSLFIVVALSTTPVFADNAARNSCTSLLSDAHCLQELTKDILTIEKNSILDMKIVDLEKTLAVLKQLTFDLSGQNKSTY